MSATVTVIVKVILKGVAAVTGTVESSSRKSISNPKGTSKSKSDSNSNSSSNSNRDSFFFLNSNSSSNTIIGYIEQK